MLRPGVTQEWVDEGELPMERTKNRRWRRPYDVLAEATHGEVVVRVHHTRIWTGSYGGMTRSYWELHFGYDTTRRRAMDSRSECRGTAEAGMIGAAGELDYFSAHIRLREPDKSEDKAECKATDSRAMGLAALWYHRGGASVESSISCSQGGRALVVKGAKEVENAKTNSKYQDSAKGQRPKNFIRPVSMGFSSR
ncbi:hypothetical protein GW17_00043202 [Ensete ventricosum]|nr:hypothetical protein GW17_00043202 [Ensete ventricosum]